MPDFDRIRVLLHSDGRLHWEPGGIFKTTCDIDIGNFPFDTQHCPLLIGAYSYYRSAVSISGLTAPSTVHGVSQKSTLLNVAQQMVVIKSNTSTADEF